MGEYILQLKKTFEYLFFQLSDSNFNPPLVYWLGRHASFCAQRETK